MRSQYRALHYSASRGKKYSYFKGHIGTKLGKLAHTCTLVLLFLYTGAAANEQSHKNICNAMTAKFWHFGGLESESGT